MRLIQWLFLLPWVHIPVTEDFKCKKIVPKTSISNVIEILIIALCQWVQCAHSVSSHPVSCMMRLCLVILKLQASFQRTDMLQLRKIQCTVLSAEIQRKDATEICQALDRPKWFHWFWATSYRHTKLPFSVHCLCRRPLEHLESGCKIPVSSPLPAGSPKQVSRHPVDWRLLPLELRGGKSCDSHRATHAPQVQCNSEMSLDTYGSKGSFLEARTSCWLHVPDCLPNLCPLSSAGSQHPPVVTWYRCFSNKIQKKNSAMP